MMKNVGYAANPKVSVKKRERRLYHSNHLQGTDCGMVIGKYAGAGCILQCMYANGVINRATYEAAVTDLENRISGKEMDI